MFIISLDLTSISFNKNIEINYQLRVVNLHELVLYFVVILNCLYDIILRLILEFNGLGLYYNNL